MIKKVNKNIYEPVLLLLLKKVCISLIIFITTIIDL